MSTSESPAGNVDEQDPPERVEVGVYPDLSAGFDHGLVVLASGDPFWLEAMGDSFRLLVEPSAAERAREQLARYDHESINWPPRAMEDVSRRSEASVITPLIWCLSVMLSFLAQGEYRDWTTAGLLDAQAVFDRGEVWRLVTALFLHSDVGHLISNVVSGVLVFTAVLMTIGHCRGWALIALASVFGNLAVAAAQYPGDYRSLGASTAIFSAVGLLTGRALRVMSRAAHPHRWRTLLVPLAAGLTVLGLYGAGGQQVDVMAHVTGFGAGLVLGLVASPQS